MEFVIVEGGGDLLQTLTYTRTRRDVDGLTTVKWLERVIWWQRLRYSSVLWEHIFPSCTCERGKAASTVGKPSQILHLLVEWRASVIDRGEFPLFFSAVTSRLNSNPPLQWTTKWPPKVRQMHFPPKKFPFFVLLCAFVRRVWIFCRGFAKWKKGKKTHLQPQLSLSGERKGSHRWART